MQRRTAFAPNLRAGHAPSIAPQRQEWWKYAIHAGHVVPFGCEIKALQDILLLTHALYPSSLSLP